MKDRRIGRKETGRRKKAGQEKEKDIKYGRMNGREI